MMPPEMYREILNFKKAHSIDGEMIIPLMNFSGHFCCGIRFDDDSSYALHLTGHATERPKL
jgi:hypothetical protein